MIGGVILDIEKIGKFIHELRKGKNWTQDDLAQRLSVDRTIVSKWERGIYIPNPEYLLKLQELFNVSVNEILFGERRNINNEEKIDTLPIEILNSNKKRIKKILISSSIVIVLLVISFLSYYFINNYNSINVYRVFGENKNFSINDGIIIVSREKSYIKLGKLKTTDNNHIVKTRLYFINSGQEQNVFIGGVDTTEALFVNTFDYNELFTYSDIKHIINNLYLEVTLDSGKIQLLELDVKKDFANNNIFNDGGLPPVSNNTSDDSKNKIPEYIKDNFLLNEDSGEYYYEKNFKDYKEVQKFLYNANLFIVSRKYDTYEENFEYSIKDDFLTYYLIKNNNMENNFIYNLADNSCEVGNCDKQIVDIFTKNYFSNISK